MRVRKGEVATRARLGANVLHRQKMFVGWAPLFVVFLIYAYFAWVVKAPFFGDKYNMVNILIQVSPLLIATCGQMVAMATGGVDISIGAIAAFSSMMMALGAIALDSPWGILAGVVVGALLGAMNGFVIARYRISPVIVTIAMLSVARGLAFLMTDGRPLTGIPPSMYWFAWGDWLGIPAPVIVAAIIFALTEYFLGSTRIGVHLRAVGSDEAGARLMGVGVGGLKVLAFALSGLAGALASIIWTAQSGGGNQLIGNGLELQTIAAAVIGGAADRRIRTAWGGLWGAFVIVTLSNGMNLSGVQPYSQQIVLGLVLIMTVLFHRFQDRVWGRLKLLVMKGADSDVNAG